MAALLALPIALLLGLAAGVAMAALIVAAPFALAYDFIRRCLPRRAPKPH